MITKQDYNNNLIQSILSDCDVRGIMKSQSFFENICDELSEDGELTINYTSAEFVKEHPRGNIEIFGYDYDEERRVLTLINQEFFQNTENISGLIKLDIENKLNRVRRFFELCSNKVYQELEETSPEYSMAYIIYKYLCENKVDKVRLMLITNGENRTKKNIDIVKNISDIPLEFRIIDINYLYNLYLSNSEEGDSIIDVDLSYLKAADQDDYSSYLTMLSGEDIYNIYDKYGQRLLEQNVRTFLQFKGAVNKGIRTTLEREPTKFFAYNNGITATASEIEIGSDNKIKKLINFQIVNGGQTTSAIYSAKKKSSIDISKVLVQMKLSVVRNKEIHSSFVSKVSEYANTQNKVNKSDFFSNSPFHQEFKEYSRRVWSPATNESQQKTKWFYERVRGEYLNEQSYLKEKEKRLFQLEYPKTQFLDKLLLAKSENSWNRRPDIVSKGAQYSFIHFADQINDKIENNHLSITEGYFKEIVSKVIIFNKLEKIISKASWYKQSYRAQTVAYTLALLSEYLYKNKLIFNFDEIWKNQNIPEEFEELLNSLAEIVYEEINYPEDGSTNIGQWCKKSSCWHSIKNIELEIEIPKKLLTTKEVKKVEIKEDKKLKQLDHGIHIQSVIVNLLENKCWKKMYDHYSKYKDDYNISPLQMDILRSIAEYKIHSPSEKQSKILYSLYERAISENIIEPQN